MVEYRLKIVGGYNGIIYGSYKMVGCPIVK
jgi:hypothetical protein